MASTEVIAGVGLAASEITSGHWLTFSGGVLVGGLSIAATIGIAWRQRIIEIRDRTADRTAKEQRDREERDRQARILNRELWADEHRDIRELLNLGETIIIKVIAKGPCTAAELATLQLDEFKTKAVQLSGWGVEALREPLLELADLAERLIGNAVPEPTEVIAAYSTASGGTVPEDMHPRAGWNIAISQNDVARELRTKIAAARVTLKTEWGQ
jgi:hypothetical protein